MCIAHVVSIILMLRGKRACLFSLRDAWAEENDDCMGTHSSYICPDIYFLSHPNSACMHCIPCLTVLKCY
jgi:hypothetical protein